MADGVRLLSGADAPDVRRLLQRDPVAYAMVAERVDVMGLGGGLGAEIWGWFTPEGLQSALYIGANVVPVEVGAQAVAAFARRARFMPRRCSSIVGYAPAVLDFFQQLQGAWGPERAIRRSQPLMTLSGSPACAPDPAVRPGTLPDLPLVFPACVKMFTEELGSSPLGADGGAAYRQRVQWLIDDGRSFVRIDGSTLVFKAEIGVLTAEVAQVQGVWVPPELRGRGIGTAAMAAVVAHIQQGIAPVTSLYVNDFNAAALSVYRRVGFQQVGEFATVLF